VGKVMLALGGLGKHLDKGLSARTGDARAKTRRSEL